MNPVKKKVGGVILLAGGLMIALSIALPHLSASKAGLSRVGLIVGTFFGFAGVCQSKEYL